MTREAKQITADEARYLFLNQLSGLAEYWDDVEGKSSLEKLEGLLFSVMVALDGGSGGLPGYAVVPMGQEVDIEYAKNEGFDYYPEPNINNDISGFLHEDLGQHLRNEAKRPENLYDFGNFLADEMKRKGF
jgi:hypothetical protein